jgi:IS30 family transposase
MGYNHLSFAERYYIEIESKLGKSFNQIACDLGRSQSAISREVSRNSGLRGYRHQQANQLAQQRHQDKAKAVKLTCEIKFIIDVCLTYDWSPEQIAGRLFGMDLISLHHESIYQYILADKPHGGQLYKHLRHKNKTYRKRYRTGHNRTGIPNRRDIDDRPAAANNRERIGDGEAATIIANKHKGAIVTLDERKTKIRFAAPLPCKRAVYVTEAITPLLDPVKDFVKTITFDNDKEFTQHEKIAEATEPNFAATKKKIKYYQSVGINWSCALALHLSFCLVANVVLITFPG